ncbi:uncharacterized protein PHALS_05588 [Plasmopara halstedii]|uniref:Uncharacterized protein n=1 Tax=Plasmopara halstedii TaxID=4781 RepID=A0A0P1B1M6_PLAHL|nr:uncharacterized protein PHALS_05588 [Plasmopara halstedii]CEG48114.1 hypothetical protein PHALS_05588 [Plasmopara halstedii]|eukprot:XP_024584483.1 hypothetical protein PHALS_05588 [Plasmopara halstedii]
MTVQLLVVSGNLDHQNCVSVAKPSRIQFINNPVVRGALAANPATSTNALVVQLRHHLIVALSYCNKRNAPPPVC